MAAGYGIRASGRRGGEDGGGGQDREEASTEEIEAAM
jgi:hypothetical protein